MSQQPPPLAERADIHKACKSLETLLNLLNDYCEAASAIVTLQKKLAKSLRDNAGLKTNTDIAANSLSATANIYEALADIDSKYSKLADREYDAISSEVKKWFKKLAKEEKAHDDRMASANAKLKQASQSYEKKSKKNARDASEEHARYINLINTLGPEVSQEKYNHQRSMTQKHTLTTYSVCSTLTRLADAEWVRSCESVRRFSPNIGMLGECRALCEGGWTGDVPFGLPDIDEEEAKLANIPPTANADSRPMAMVMTPSGSSAATTTTEELHTIAPRTLPHPPPLQFPTPETHQSLQSQTPSQPPSIREFDAPPPPQIPQTQPAQTPPSTSISSSPPIHPPISSLSSSQPTPSQPPPSSWQSPSFKSAAPPSLFHSSDRGMGTDADTTGSVRTLSAFPSPPSHYPLPPIRQASGSQSSSAEAVAASGGGRGLSDSPLPLEEHERKEKDQAPWGTKGASANGDKKPPSRQSTLDNHSEGEFGASQNGNHSKPRVSLERNNSSPQGSGSMVAAMRNKYTASAGIGNPSPPASPTTREQPANVRLGAGRRVSDLATRYEYQSPSSTSGHEPSDSPSRPHPGNVSPAQTRDDHSSLTPRASFSLSTTTPTTPSHHHPTDDNFQHKEELLRQREKEIELKARELEMEREKLGLEVARLTGGNASERGRPRADESGARGGGSSDHNQLSPISRGGSGIHLRPRERRASFQTPSSTSQNQQPLSSPHMRSQVDLSSSGNPVGGLSRPYSQYSGNSHHASTSNLPLEYDSSQSSKPLDHAPSCGCPRCSISAYQHAPSAPTPHDLRPISKPVSLRPEKPTKSGGWMRRLSMPVVAQFTGSDFGKKGGISNIPGVSSSSNHLQHQQQYQAQRKAGLLSLDARKTSGVGGPLRGQLEEVSEDGRYPSLSAPNGDGNNGMRRSYDSGPMGMENRSASSVGGRR